MSSIPRQEIEDRLAKAASRRDDVEKEARAAARTVRDQYWDEVEQLLRAGQEEGLTVSAMMRLAGISRETAYSLLRGERR